MLAVACTCIKGSAGVEQKWRKRLSFVLAHIQYVKFYMMNQRRACKDWKFLYPLKICGKRKGSVLSCLAIVFPYSNCVEYNEYFLLFSLTQLRGEIKPNEILQSNKKYVLCTGWYLIKKWHILCQMFF